MNSMWQAFTVESFHFILHLDSSVLNSSIMLYLLQNIPPVLALLGQCFGLIEAACRSAVVVLNAACVRFALWDN